MNIQELANKIKPLSQKGTHSPGFSHQKLYTALIVILVGTLGFGLGRLSIQTEIKGPVSIIDSGNSRGSAKDNQKLVAEPVLIGAKDEKTFYFNWCSEAQAIPENNRRYFATVFQATQARYQPAEDCKKKTQTTAD